MFSADYSRNVDLFLYHKFYRMVADGTGGQAPGNTAAAYLFLGGILHLYLSHVADSGFRAGEYPYRRMLYGYL